MTPGTYDLKVYRGDSYTWGFTLWYDDARTQPVILGNGIPKAEIRDKSGGLTIIPMNCIVMAPNRIQVYLTPANSSLVPFCNAVWDLQVTFSPTDVRTYVAGRVLVTADVTDSVAVPAGSLR